MKPAVPRGRRFAFERLHSRGFRAWPSPFGVYAALLVTRGTRRGREFGVTAPAVTSDIVWVTGCFASVFTLAGGLPPFGALLSRILMRHALGQRAPTALRGGVRAALAGQMSPAFFITQISARAGEAGIVSPRRRY